MRDSKQQTLHPTASPTIAPEIEQFLTDLQRQEPAANTLASYRFDLLHFSRWFRGTLGEDFSPTAVTPTDIREYRSFLINSERRQPATVNRRLAALRKFFLWAKATGLISELPTDQVKGIPEVRKRPKWLEKREVDRLLRMVEHSGSKRDLAIVQLLRHTGVRVAELTNVQLDDVELSERKGSLTIRSGKGGKQRTLPLNNDVRRALQEYQGVRATSPDPQLFLSSRSRKMTTRAVQDLITKYAHQAGLSEVTPHTLRHSFGKSLVDAGVDLVTVATLMGHQRLDTTAVYTQPGAKDLERAVAVLEQDADLAPPPGRSTNSH